MKSLFDGTDYDKKEQRLSGLLQKDMFLQKTNKAYTTTQYVRSLLENPDLFGTGVCEFDTVNFMLSYIEKDKLGIGLFGKYFFTARQNTSPNKIHHLDIKLLGKDVNELTFTEWKGELEGRINIEEKDTDDISYMILATPTPGQEFSNIFSENYHKALRSLK